MAQVNVMSCTMPGNCSAAGIDAIEGLSAFVATETSGTWSTWGKAIEVPGTATLNAGGNAQANSVSCTAADTCTAGGFYTASPGHSTAFVISKTPPAPAHAR